MVAFTVDTTNAFDSSVKPALIEGLGESQGGLFQPTLPVHHCVQVIAARAQKMGFNAFALRGKLVVQQRDCAVPQQLVQSCPERGNKWVAGLPVTRSNTLAAAMRVASR